MNGYVLLKSDQIYAPGESCTKGDEDDEVAFFCAFLSDDFVECDGDGSRRGISVAIDIDEHFFIGDFHAFNDGLDDSSVHLVGDDHGDIV